MEVPQAVMARYVMVIFVCVDASHNVVLNLMSEVSIVSLPLVNFKVAQGSGVTFASGQNVSVDFDLKVCLLVGWLVGCLTSQQRRMSMSVFAVLTMLEAWQLLVGWLVA